MWEDIEDESQSEHPTDLTDFEGFSNPPRRQGTGTSGEDSDVWQGFSSPPAPYVGKGKGRAD
jgi:hypothetical protein